MAKTETKGLKVCRTDSHLLQFRVVGLFLLSYRYVSEFKCLSLNYGVKMPTISGNLCTGSNIYLKV